LGTNLTDWPTVYSTLSDTNGLILFTDPSGLPYRFYRVDLP
jgi:hypothetical protein